MNSDDTNRPAASLARRSVVLAPLALGGCAFLDTLFGDTKKKLPGKREDVLPVNQGLQAPTGQHPTVVLPPASSTDWPMEGRNAPHDGGNAALPDTLRQAWASSIGEGSSYRKQVTSTPVTAGGRVFTMDSSANVAAFSADTGRRLWNTHTRPKKNRTTNIGGGIAVADGMVYAATGFGEVLAINQEDGHIDWRQPLDTPARSAPTIVHDRMFLITIDQELVALALKDGKQIWFYDGTATSTTLLGQPAPACSGGIVVAGFGSGDLVALRSDSGAVAWTDSIASATTGQVGLGLISAISSMPVIVGEVAAAIGTGGLMVAVDLRAGRRLWEREVSGIQPLAAAGDFIFVTTANQQVGAVRATTGEVAWLAQLPNYRRPKTQGGAIIWTGPVLAGGALIYAGTRNDLLMIDATTGVQRSSTKLPDSVTVQPIAANGTLYIITDDGMLRAYR